MDRIQIPENTAKKGGNCSAYRVIAVAERMAEPGKRQQDRRLGRNWQREKMFSVAKQRLDITNQY